MAVVVDLDVLPGLVARVAAELVIVGPHGARVVVVAPEDCARITTPLRERLSGLKGKYKSEPKRKLEPRRMNILRVLEFGHRRRRGRNGASLKISPECRLFSSFFPPWTTNDASAAGMGGRASEEEGANGYLGRLKRRPLARPSTG